MKTNIDTQKNQIALSEIPLIDRVSKDGTLLIIGECGGFGGIDTGVQYKGKNVRAKLSLYIDNPAVKPEELKAIRSKAREARLKKELAALQAAQTPSK